MTLQNHLKIINDPIYGFITIPTQLVFDLMKHPYFQRLRRISQMGLSYLVYPGAHHTRFQHALGAMYLMQKATQVLVAKGVEISFEEAEALYIAILLHDIGHGPFSHAMENSIVEKVSHEELSLLFMEVLNQEFNNRLTLAIQIFKNEYSRKFMHQLVSGQLDMDRLDYLKRDSFYTGVSEGAINSVRLISMLNVVDDKLVIEEKGIYSVEKFIISRRFMYWQVYLHKTGLVAEQLLLKVLKRAKELSKKGVVLHASSALSYFLNHHLALKDFDKTKVSLFSELDDYDIIMALKSWQEHEDFVLSNLSKMIINRNLMKITLQNNKFEKEIIQNYKERVIKTYQIDKEDVSYFVFTGKIGNQAYSIDKEAINLVKKSGEVIELTKISDQLKGKGLSQPVIKHYMCTSKSIY
ncbi:MAG: HD domain-containing protein [Flavobacteriales bacterium]